MNKIKFNILFLILISSIGPYIFKRFGLRLEHIVIYSGFIFYIAKNNSLNIKSSKVFSIMILSLLIPILAELSNKDVTNYAQLFAGIDNYLLFAMVYYIASIYIKKYKKFDFLKNLILLNLNILSINSIIALLQSAGFLSNFLTFFHSTTLENLETDVLSVSVSSSNMMRFSGIFDQPLEAGFAYSLGLLSLIYISKFKIISNIKLLLYMFLLVLGGSLCVSKVFIYGGMFLSIIYIVIIQKLNLKLILFCLSAIGVTFMGLLFSGGLEFFQRLLIFKDILANVLYGRYEEGSGIINGINSLVGVHFIIGNGFTGVSIYDSGYFQYIMQGGMLELALQFYLIMYLTLTSYVKSKDFFWFIFLINLLQLLALLGGPTALANRSPIYLAMIYACITNSSFQKKVVNLK